MAKTSRHPLAQLTAQEFAKARDIVVQAHKGSEPLYFRATQLEEPPREDLIPFLEAEHDGSLSEITPRPPRCARVEYDLLKDKKHDHAHAVVDLDAEKVVSTSTKEGEAYPFFTADEFSKCRDVCFNSKLFKDAMAEFILPEGFEITIDPWPTGGAEEADEPRLLQGLVFARDASKVDKHTNHYGYPIPIIPVMDWVTQEVVRVDRLPTGGSGEGLEPAPRGDTPKKLFGNSTSCEYVPELLEVPVREDLKPLNVIQPEGASFTIDDGLVEWQRWRFRLSFTPREGAVLHDVTYQDRPVFYRLSFSELTVPYGDPRPPFHRKQAFDFGDGGVGRAANNLTLGCDCLGAIHYVDSYLTAPDGSPDEAKSVICLHEQDNGILWKHTNFRSGHAVVARSREFVVQFICTLANYEYIFAYKFDLAGGATMETRATGMVSVTAIDEGKTSRYGNVVAPGILAQNHQHIFAARVDPAIDGYRDTRVVVEESHPCALDASTNPYGNLYEVRREVVDTPRFVDSEPRLNRTLKFENVHKKNPISGKNRGYKMVAPATQPILAQPDGIVGQRAKFAAHNAWVTGYRDGEYWAAGEFTNQSTVEKGGVADMVARDDRLADDGLTNGAKSTTTGQTCSPVVWPVYGFTHNPRVEDWPVMPMEMYQIHLRPTDFFDANPALDVPSAANKTSVLVPCCSTQNDPLAHRQGDNVGVDAKQAGASVDKGERRLSKVITGLFKKG